MHSSDNETESGTDASSMVLDEPLVSVAKKTRKRGLAHVDADKLDENYCGLCGTVHLETCYMVQNPDKLAEYRAMLMEVTNEEPIETRVSGLAPGQYISVLMSYLARSSPSNRREALKDGKARLNKGSARVPCR